MSEWLPDAPWCLTRRLRNLIVTKRIYIEWSEGRGQRWSTYHHKRYWMICQPLRCHFHCFPIVPTYRLVAYDYDLVRLRRKPRIRFKMKLNTDYTCMGTWILSTIFSILFWKAGTVMCPFSMPCCKNKWTERNDFPGEKRGFTWFDIITILYPSWWYSFSLALTLSFSSLHPSV